MVTLCLGDKVLTRLKGADGPADARTKDFRLAMNRLGINLRSPFAVSSGSGFSAALLAIRGFPFAEAGTGDGRYPDELAR